MEKISKDAKDLIDNARILLSRLDRTLNKIDHSRLVAARLIVRGACPLGETWLCQEEVTELMCISRRTLKTYRDEGVLPYYHFQGKILYKASDIKKHLEENYGKGRSPY